MSTPRLATSQGITKRYPGVVANQDRCRLDRDAPGQIHAVLGRKRRWQIDPDENHLRHRQARRRRGGVQRPNCAGAQPPRGAGKLGISMVFQHFSLFDTLTVAENVWLGLDKSLSPRRCDAKASKAKAERIRLGDRDRAPGAHLVASVRCSAWKSSARFAHPAASCSSWMSPPRCSRRKRSRQAVRGAAQAWPAEGVQHFVHQRTSSTKSARCAVHCAVLAWRTSSRACATRAKRATRLCSAA